MALLLAEVGLRLAGVPGAGAGLAARIPYPAFFRVPHPVYGWSLQPGARYVNPLPEGAVRVEINDAGWRDVAHPVEKPAGVFRVAVLGDSFAEAYSVNLEDAFHRRLQSALRDGGDDVETLNFAVGGYGTLQEYLVFHHQAVRYAPDLVLLEVCVANDVRNNSRELEEALAAVRIDQRSRPFLLPEATGGWHTTAVDFAAAEQRYVAWRRAYETARTRRGPLDRLLDHSVLVALLRRASAGSPAAAAAFPEGPRADGSGGAEPDRGPADGAAPPSREALTLAVHGVHACRPTPAYERAWRTTGRILRRLRDEVRGGGAELVIVTAPAYHEVSPRGREAVLREGAGADLLCLEEAPGYARLAGLAGDLGVPLVDLRPAFLRAADPDALFNGRSDRHWNARGHALAAERVGQALKRLGLVPVTEPKPGGIGSPHPSG